MYYYGARYYDPRISIFISVDPLAEQFVGWTPYHYVHQNPINLIDPTGMSAYPPPGGNEGDTWIDQDGSWKFTGGIWEDTTGGGNDMYSDQLAPVEITKDNRSVVAKMVDGIMNDFRREALAMVPGNSSGSYGMPMGPDAMSIGGSFGVSLGIINFNATLSLAATGDDAALVYGFDYGVGEFTKPGFGGGITLNAHNLFGGSTDILNELGGEDLTYSAGYLVKGSYGVSSRTIRNKTMHAESGAKTYGLGLGYGGGVSKSNTNVNKFSNLRKDMSQGASRIQNAVLQAITPPKMF